MTTSRITARWSRGRAGRGPIGRRRIVEWTGTMIDRGLAVFRSALIFLWIIVFAGTGRADDLQREVDALRPKDTAAQGQAVLDNLERRASEALGAIPRSFTAVDADRMRGPLRR